MNVICISRFTMGPWIHDRFLDSRWVLHPQEGGILDAKKHYVILAKVLDGIWPVGHACAVMSLLASSLLLLRVLVLES